MELPDEDEGLERFEGLESGQKPGMVVVHGCALRKGLARVCSGGF